MDKLLEDHFRFEATSDVDGVVASLTDDVAHEVIPSPMGALRGQNDARSFYEMLFASLDGESVTPVRRLYGDSFVVDESIWEGQITDGRAFLCDGASGRARFLLLHVFEIEGERISSEQVWCDLAAIQSQLGTAPAARQTA
jgi:hypothetical protein